MENGGWTTEDWTRRELAEVLEREAHVVPVLVAPRTEPLRRSELPPALARLAALQFRQFNARTKDQDLRTLGDGLAQLLPGGEPADATDAPPPAQHTNSARTGGDSTTVQARDISGGIGSLISNPQGPVHSGQGNQYNGSHHPQFPGAGQVNYVAGTNNGGMHQSSGPRPSEETREDDQR